ncbi:MAG: CpsD/CapB family tyrosine-protein kinase [Acidimicrobiales bacterium]
MAPNRGTGSPELIEAMRIIRSNLTVALPELGESTVMVTSAEASEGKTVVCSNLAVAFASAGWRVVVADLDLRDPSLHTRFGISNDVGLTDVLLEQAPLSEVLQYVELEGQAQEQGLYVAPAGPSVDQPTELLSAKRAKQLISSLAVQADLVLIDAAPVLPVADTLIVGRMVAGAILVVESGRTPTERAQQAKDALIRSQTRLLGAVLNKVESRHLDSGYGYGPELEE